MSLIWNLNPNPGAINTSADLKFVTKQIMRVCTFLSLKLKLKAYPKWFRVFIFCPHTSKSNICGLNACGFGDYVMHLQYYDMSVWPPSVDNPSVR